MRRTPLAIILACLAVSAAAVPAGKVRTVKADRSSGPTSAEYAIAARVAIGVGVCIVDNAGAVKCWGSNTTGANGLGTKSGTVVTPTQVPGLTSGWTSVSRFGSSSCATNSAGESKCWGNNWFAQNGNGTTSNVNTPFNGTDANDNASPVNVLAASSGARDTVPGYSGSCTLKTSGDLICWGHPWTRGAGVTTEITLTSSVVLLTGVSTVALATHNCALQGTDLKCWGYDGESNLGGIGTQYVPFTFATGVSQFALGDWHTCYVTTAGALKCIGYNDSGQVGSGTASRSLAVLTTPPGMSTGVLSVAAGTQHTCALLTDRTVKCWGRNASGQLGDGTTTNRLAPTNVTGLGGPVQAIVAGQSTTCAILVSGQLQCWGTTPGNGSAQSNVPVTVTAFGGAVLSSQSPLIVSSTSATYGSSLALTTTGGSGSGAVTFSLVSAGTAGCSVSGSTLSFTSAGSCTVTATKAADSTYASATSSVTTVNIAKASQTVTWSPVLSHGTSASPVTFAAASSNGPGAVSYSVVSHTSASCTVNSGARSLTFSGAGNCVVQAAAASTATHDPDTLNKTFVLTDDEAPTLTLAASSATSSVAMISFTLTGDEPINCATLTSADLTVTNIDSVDSVTQTTQSRCTISATSSVQPGDSGTSSVRASGSFSVSDTAGNARTSISSGSPASTVVTIADTTAPVLTLAAVSSTSSSTSVSFTLTGNERLNCATLTSADLLLDGIASIDSVTQTSQRICTIAATASVNPGASRIVSVRAAGGFSVEDAAGNAQTSISAGSPASVQVTVPAATTTTTVAGTSTTSPTALAAQPTVDAPVTPVAVTTTTQPVKGSSASTSSVPAAQSAATTVPAPSVTTTRPPRPSVTAPAPGAGQEPPVTPESIKSAGEGVVTFVDGVPMTAKSTAKNGAITVEIAGITSSMSTAGGETNLSAVADGRLSLRRGDTFTMTGQGFAPASPVEIWMYSSPSWLMTGVADAAGGLVAQPTVPDDAASGEHRIVVSAESPRGQQVVIAFPAKVLEDSVVTRIASSPITWVTLVLVVFLALFLPSRLRRDTDN